MVISTPVRTSAGLSWRRTRSSVSRNWTSPSAPGARLDRDDHPVGGGEGVDRHRPERGRAVEQREREPLAHRPEPVAQMPLQTPRPGAARRPRRQDPGSPARSRGCPGRRDGQRRRPRSHRRGIRRRRGSRRGSSSATVALRTESRSTRSTWQPLAAMQAGRLTAVVVLPTPPSGSRSRTPIPSRPTLARGSAVPARTAGGAEGALLRHPGAARQPVGVGPTLRSRCRCRFPAPAREGRDPPARRRSPASSRLDRAPPPRRDLGGPSRRPASRPAAAAAPRARRRWRAGRPHAGDHVVGLAPPRRSSRRLLGPRTDRPGIPRAWRRRSRPR